MLNIIRFSVIITGFSGIVAQLLLLRELLIVFSGNELSIGIIIANWLLFEALGSFFSGKKAESLKNNIETYALVVLFFSLFLPFTVYYIRILKNILDISIGQNVGIFPVFYSSFILLGPVSFLHGALFSLSCKVYYFYCKNKVSLNTVKESQITNNNSVKKSVNISKESQISNSNCNINKNTLNISNEREISNSNCNNKNTLNISKKKDVSIGNVYVYEILGTVLGGILWTYLFIPYINSFYIVFAVIVLNLISILSIFYYAIISLKTFIKINLFRKFVVSFTLILFIILIFLFFNGNIIEFHYNSIRKQWKVQNIIHYQNSYYGNISIIENQNQYIFFLDGMPHIITPIPDIEFVEEFVHIPMFSHSNPENLLIISRGAGGIINEILYHPTVKTLDYTEIDPLLLELLKKYPTDLTKQELNDKRVNVINIDGRLFLKKTDKMYDIIFVGIDEPADLQSNRFFTKEFFSLSENKLYNDGILVLSLPSSMSFFNFEMQNLNSTVFHSLKSVFNYVRVYPGESSNIFLASNHYDISLLDEEMLYKRIKTRNLNFDISVPRHILHKIHPGWSNWFDDFIDEANKVLNRDFKPLAMFYNISYWNVVFNPNLAKVFYYLQKINFFFVFVIFILIYFFIFIFYKIKKSLFSLNANSVSFAILTTGFTGMIFDLAIIFVFQAIYGYVFSWIGLLITFFMTGSALGAIKMNSLLYSFKDDNKIFKLVDLSIIGFTFILLFLFFVIQPFLDSPAIFGFFRFVLLFFSLLSGILIGIQFPLANKLYLKSNSKLSKTAGTLYAADLIGGWFGGIVGSVVLFPVLGIFSTLVIVILLKILGFLFFCKS